MRSSLFLLVALTVAATGTLPLAPSAEAKQPAKAVKLTKKIMKIPAPARGASAKKAVVEIVEFSDFECPFCKRVKPTLATLMAKYPGKIRHVWRHRPLAFHKNARAASRAAIAAGKKFWAFHDAIWNLKRGWGPDDLDVIASNLGLNLAKWVAARDSAKTEAIIVRDENIATATGNNGTPSFLINGIQLRGAQPLQKFVTIVEAELAAGKVKGKKGRGKKWLSARTKANNPTLWSFVYDKKIPPVGAKAAARPYTPKPIDSTVWKVDVVPNRDGTDGAADALVTIVEFGDLQCPFCARLAPTLKKLVADYGGQVRLVFRHNPLPFHKDAFRAAEATLCAKEQGSFWAMHDVLFANMKAMGPNAMAGLAMKAGVADLPAFEECFNSRRYEAHVKADMAAARRATATGTPATFVNGRKVTGARPYSAFKSLVDEELKKAKKLVKKGTKRADVYATIQKGAQSKTAFAKKAVKLKPGNAATSGDPDNAPVVVTAFIDLQCPFSKRAFPMLAEAATKRPGKIAVVVRNFPLPFHREAKKAAVAAECAHRQGRFWQMADRLFNADRGLKGADEQTFESLAQDAGVADSTMFMTCMAGTGTGSALAQVEGDMKLGRQVGVRGTPTVFVNGRAWKPKSGYTLANLEADADAAGMVKKLGAAEAAKAIQLAKAACDKNPRKCNQYGDMLSNHGDKVQQAALAAAAYRRACDAGSALGCVSIAQRHRSGHGVKKDLEAAKRDLLRACNMSAGKLGCEE